MKYFLHDSTAFSDEKITLLYLKFGYEAIGLYFTILEKLALQEQPINEIVLKSQLNIKKRLEKQLEFMYEIDLLSVKNGDIFSKNLLNFNKKYIIKKEKNRKRILDWRNNKIENNFLQEKEILRNVYKYFDLEIIKKLTKIQKQEWIETINKLNKIDNFDFEAIQETIIWGRNNEFWKSNFFSISGLRKKNNNVTKFFQMNKKMNYEKASKNRIRNNQDEDIRKIAEQIANDPDLA